VASVTEKPDVTQNLYPWGKKSAKSLNHGPHRAYLIPNRAPHKPHVKNDLFQAEFNNTPLPNAPSQIASCNAVLNAANNLATS
jgi:hypothetical protein